MSSIKQFPSEEYEVQFVKFFSDIFKIINKEESFNNKLALIFGAILYRYPLTSFSLLPEVLTYNVLQEEHNLEPIKEVLEKIKILNLFPKINNEPKDVIDLAIYNDYINLYMDYFKFNNKNIKFISSRKYSDYSSYLLELLKNYKIQKATLDVFKEKIKPSLEEHLKNFLINRFKEYCEIIPIASSERGKETFKEDLNNVIGFSEILLVTFSTENLPWPEMKDSIKNALKEGIIYKILLIKPELGEKLEKSKGKEEIEKGIIKIRAFKRELIRQGILRKRKNFQYRLIKKEKYADFFGLIKISKKGFEHQSLYRCFIKRNFIERGINAIILRGHYEDNSLFRIIRLYLDIVWKKSEEVGILGWIKKKKIYLYITALFFVVTVIRTIFCPIKFEFFFDILLMGFIFIMVPKIIERYA